MACWHLVRWSPILNLSPRPEFRRPAPRASFARRLRSSRWTIRYRKFDWTLNESGVVSEEEGGSPLLWIYLVPAGLLLLFGLYSFRMLFRRRAGSLGEP